MIGLQMRDAGRGVLGVEDNRHAGRVCGERLDQPFEQSTARMFEGFRFQRAIKQAERMDEVVAIDKKSVGHESQAAQKKERRSCLRLLSMGIGRRNGRLGGVS